MRDERICPHPEKQKYESKTIAKQHLSRFRRMGRGTLRPYRCRCGWWHLGHNSPPIPKIRERDAVYDALGLDDDERAYVEADPMLRAVVNQSLGTQMARVNYHAHCLGMLLAWSFGLVRGEAVEGEVVEEDVA